MTQGSMSLVIESLPGYCDSINLLRCILRSNHMIAVISAFDTLLEKIRDTNSRKCELAPLVDESHEFRIVQEWKF